MIGKELVTPWNDIVTDYIGLDYYFVRFIKKVYHNKRKPLLEKKKYGL